MKRIERLADQTWQNADYGPDSEPLEALWHQAFETGFRVARVLAAREIERELEGSYALSTRLADRVCALGEEEAMDATP
jgi:hypothetical protein